ncbi:sensor histidine kinase [Luteococcus peritonei]|uniref:Sensor histidine kinase n=1 Tax=Luteococcus peritonei TaxID=88874 RepID=A0ABW4RTF4_9ACTN
MANWQHRVLGSTSQERFDRFTRSSMYFLFAVCPFVALAGIASVPQQTATWRLLSCAVVALVGLVLAALTLRRGLDHGLGRTELGTPWRRALWLVAGLCLLLPLAVLPGVDRHNLWGNGPAVAMAACLPCVVVLSCATSMRATHLMAAGLVAVPTVVGLLRSGPAALPSLLVVVFYVLLFVYTGRLSAWMMGVVEELAQARSTAARLAVAEERLRFSRDLHDVVGRSLSAVAVKSQLAAELARRGQAEAAVTEMEAVHGVATESLAEMREVVAGYRRVDLAVELSGARAMLASAGIGAEVLGAEVLGADTAAELGAESQQALAWVVREGVTNVVRHSRATRCRILLEVTDRARLTISNDGARTDVASGTGSGLAGLRERLEAVGGSLETHHRGRDFLLVAVVDARIGA